MVYIALLLSIFIPFGFGDLIFLIGLPKRPRNIYCMAVVCVASALVFFCAAQGSIDTFTLIGVSERAGIAFRMDGLSKIFSCMLAVLWPVGTLYAFEYMSSKERTNAFFSFYTSCYGVSLGICFAANLITMFIFCELLTIFALPLIMHTRDSHSKQAGMRYLSFALMDAVASIAGIIIIYEVTGRLDFNAGGIEGIHAGGTLMIFAFLLMFFGFGIKAAVVPFSSWLPSDAAAPAPVSALLNEVAIVNAGCFAIIRVSYYIYGAHYLFDTAAQKVAIIIAALTITYGAIKAWQERNFKRRLAMSTVSNLSYILYGAMLFTPLGLLGAWMHMLYHSIMKITLFLAAGAALHQAGAENTDQLKGLGRKMPITFGALTIISLALIGVPPLCGFYSKYFLGFAGMQVGTVYSYLGIAAILISTFFTAVYILDIVIKAYFPGKDFDYTAIENVKDPDWKMTVPFILLSILCILLSLFQREIYQFITSCMQGLF